MKLTETFESSVRVNESNATSVFQAYKLLSTKSTANEYNANLI